MVLGGAIEELANLGRQLLHQSQELAGALCTERHHAILELKGSKGSKGDDDDRKCEEPQLKYTKYEGSGSDTDSHMALKVDPRFLLFEYVFDLVLRQRQVEMVRWFVANAESGLSRVQQMIMGAGKTTVVGPLLALILSNKATLVTQVSHHPLCFSLLSYILCPISLYVGDAKCPA
jgi:hypothetical protein